MKKKDKIKVAFMATVIDFGGAEKVVLELIKHIDQRRFELTPVLFTKADIKNDLLLKELRLLGIHYHTIRMDNTRFKYLTPVANLLDAYKILRRASFDLVHSHGYRSDFLGIIAAKLIGLPMISTCHGYIKTERKLKFYKTISSFLLRFSDTIIAVSDTVKKDLMDAGIQDRKVEVIQNAIQVNVDCLILKENRRMIRELLEIDQKDFVLGYVGRLSEEKGIKYLIEATSLLDGMGVPIMGLIIGEGPQRKYLEDLVEKKNIANKIVFSGFQEKIVQWISALDVFVLPSLTEGLPMALLEAMAVGIPVVASAVGGIPGLVESGKNGILVPPGDSEALKNAIRNICKNKCLRKQLSQKAQTIIKREYDVVSWVSKIEDVYLRTVSPPKTTRKLPVSSSFPS